MRHLFHLCLSLLLPAAVATNANQKNPKNKKKNKKTKLHREQQQ
jgi:hypothetical protein